MSARGGSALGGKKTKIICTIGPASEDAKTLEAMATAGMDVVRLNFSHGDYKSHKKIIDNVRKISKKLDKPIGIMLDIQGPKIRVNTLPAPIKVKQGDTVIFTHDEKNVGETDFQVVPIQADLRSSLAHDHTILIDDGKLQFRVLRVKAMQVWAMCEVGGEITSHKGINLPDSVVKIPLISQKDENDLKFGLANDVDFIALSFVQSARDVLALQKLIKKYYRKKHEAPWIISKIEKGEAVKEFPKILQYSQGAMVARGDLGLEILAEEVPVTQKRIIEQCLRTAKPSVVATQMLDSMVSGPRPTRAEVTDVANAVTDHADAVMLSQETAVGKYPVEAVTMMSKIVEETEKSPYDDLSHGFLGDQKTSRAAAVADSAHELSKSTKAKAIVGATLSGFTARMIAHQRPQNAEIIMMTNSEKTYNQLSLVWGVRPYILKRCKTLDELIQQSIGLAKKRKIVSKGDKIVIVTGQPVGIRENMNLVEVQTV
ncbi:MAG: pyruvate kinase [Candidatus Doudnabacteria bacterium RIFCSPHIGHO2_01_FULL_43_23]|uniref:Pyruvate kinase n=1 Tax=Candidatus Doudnabacteria bacterium RIFCSPHIGHO2_01_FULL_43_23 TaxID=1817822 RepID=A0A1F5NW23_9BACT|nr:MAG: pyruvate kinase [Candidatus Doudnabacteria bacterium RIFCSPHIGHO2_01_FULL_43_23]